MTPPAAPAMRWGKSTTPDRQPAPTARPFVRGGASRIKAARPGVDNETYPVRAEGVPRPAMVTVAAAVLERARGLTRPADSTGSRPARTSKENLHA